MTEIPGLAATLATGAVLGWSVAWPPGPINAEIVRRGLTHGFWSAFAVGLGACSADFLWALAVALGAGAIADLPGVRPALAALSLTLLVFLAWRYLSGAWRSWTLRQRGEEQADAAGLESTRGGALLGFGMAISSPWNMAFWLAVIGHREGPADSLRSSLALAGAVVAAAATWAFVLASAVRLGARFATPAWEIGTRAAAGIVMLVFAGVLVARISE